MAIKEIIDLTEPGVEFVRDPYPVYARLRESGPVHYVRLPDVDGVWLVVGYEEARAALADPRLGKQWLPEGEAGVRSVGHNMLESDPPRHTRLRKLVAREFTSRRIAALRPRVQEVTDRLLDEMLPRGRADLVESLAFPLPMTVICELLGVPDLDRERFRGWSQAIVGNADAGQVEFAERQMGAYLAELIEDKRCGGPGDDLLSGLIRARDENGDALSSAELVGMAFLLLVAGHETTVNLIANGTLALLRHPEQLAALRADLSLLDGAIEEMLRWDGPVEIATWRLAREPLELGGRRIAAGETVLVGLASADRDGSRGLPEPDTFDIRRQQRSHLAFGHGIHYCLGAPLARLEAHVAFASLLARAPGLVLQPGRLEWRGGFLMRGVRELPVSW
ncbi:cytochrome P450 family protein [Actinacidiphila yeochonensis]|uniref:cytochrome P450 family protein n=1 Tax=Actinacidiphila yeochonensis TaxID=89050 RepID=UPI0018E3E005|nr:cytochrome P450 [Actinacidiphila yeochonensis]